MEGVSFKLNCIFWNDKSRIPVQKCFTSISHNYSGMFFMKFPPQILRPFKWSLIEHKELLNYIVKHINIWTKDEVGEPWNRFKSSSKICLLTDPRRYFFCGSFMLFLSCVCYAFVRFCLLMPCGHLLGKGWPLGSRLWCLIVSLPVGFLLLRYSVLYTVESLSLLYLLVISWFIYFRRLCIDKLGDFQANQISMCLDPHLN